jgi:saccharopine dehydrogenase-like NADP-dependent oxidoreductase
MSAMRVIDGVKAKGGNVVDFSSFCGGLPAPDSNDNPFGYKFSWAPRGVLLAGRNDARFLKDGKEVYIPGKDLFDNYQVSSFEGS